MDNLYSVIVWMTIVLKRTLAGFDVLKNLSQSFSQSLLKSVCQSMVFKFGLLKLIGQVSHDSIGWKTCVKFVNSDCSVLVSSET